MLKMFGFRKSARSGSVEVIKRVVNEKHSTHRILTENNFEKLVLKAPTTYMRWPPLGSATIADWYPNSIACHDNTVFDYVALD